MKQISQKRQTIPFWLLFSLLTLGALSACSAGAVKPATERGQFPGMPFPSVRSHSLDKKVVQIPESYLGKQTLLLIGYQQKAQFDIDRWILGVLQADIPVQIVEVPTIAGMMPQMVQSFIDNGMRSGIPTEDWAAVVPVYEDASKIVALLGNERPQSAYAVLLDEQGRIRWTSNRGYSAQQVLEVKRMVGG